MGQSEAMTSARGQIVWILALVLSTTAIIYLERLDIGTPRRSAMVSADLAASASDALTNAEQRHQAAPGDPQAAAGLALALFVAVQAGALELSEGRAREAALRGQAEGAPDWESLAVLAALTFGP